MARVLESCIDFLLAWLFARTKKGRSKGAALVNANDCYESMLHTRQSAQSSAYNNTNKHTSDRSYERWVV
jgi:hypothetical protein